MSTNKVGKEERRKTRDDIRVILVRKELRRVWLKRKEKGDYGMDKNWTDIAKLRADCYLHVGFSTPSF